MFVPESGGELSALLVNAVLLALWAALPGLILGYVRQVLAARKIGSEFALRKSEAAELDRAVRLYDEVCSRIETIEQQAKIPKHFWRTHICRTDNVHQVDAEERDDLQAHAQHLRGAIARLKRRPLQRLRAWLHVASTRSALAGAIAAYGLALAVAASHAPGQAAWADELNADAQHALAWYPLDARLFYVNAVAAAFAAAAAALFYLLRRAHLRRDYELEFCAFKDLIDSNPRRPAEFAAGESDGVAAGGGEREQRERRLVRRARLVIGRDHRRRPASLQDADQAKPPGPGARHGAGVRGAR